jgi:hypothetical protein
LYAATVYGYTHGWEPSASRRKASLVSGSLVGVWITLTIGVALLTIAPLGQFAKPANNLQPLSTPTVEVHADAKAEADETLAVDAPGNSH